MQEHEIQAGSLSSIARNSQDTNSTSHRELSLEKSSEDTARFQNPSRYSQETVQLEVSHKVVASIEDEKKFKNAIGKPDNGTTITCSSGHPPTSGDVSERNELHVMSETTSTSGSNSVVTRDVPLISWSRGEASTDNLETCTRLTNNEETSGIIKTLTEAIKMPRPLGDMCREKLVAISHLTSFVSVEEASGDEVLVNSDASTISASNASQLEENLSQEPTASCGGVRDGESKDAGGSCNDLSIESSTVLPQLESPCSENAAPNSQVKYPLQSTHQIPAIPLFQSFISQRMDSLSTQDGEVSGTVKEAILDAGEMSKELPVDVVKDLPEVSTLHGSLESSGASAIKLESLLTATESSRESVVEQGSCSSMMEKVVLSFIRSEEEEKFPFAESDNEIEQDEEEGSSGHAESSGCVGSPQDVALQSCKNESSSEPDRDTGDNGSLDAMNFESPSPLYCGPDVDTQEGVVTGNKAPSNFAEEKCTSTLSSEEPYPKRAKLLSEPEDLKDDNQEQRSASDGSLTLLQELPSESAKPWPTLPNPPPCRRHARQDDSSDEGDDNDGSNPPSCDTVQDTIVVAALDQTSSSDQLVPEDVYHFSATSCSLYPDPKFKLDKPLIKVPDGNLLPKVSAPPMPTDQVTPKETTEINHACFGLPRKGK